MVGVLVRIAVGVITDRIGAQIVLPAVSVAAAFAVLALAAVDGLPALVAVVCAIGVAGAALPAGAAAVVRAVPAGRRGTALSGVFAAGMCLSAAAGIVARATVRVDRDTACWSWPACCSAMACWPPSSCATGPARSSGRAPRGRR